MSSEYPYPPDEFDSYEVRSAPVGVHRTPRSAWSRIWPFVLVAALCATVAVVGIWLLARPHTPILPEDPLIAGEPGLGGIFDDDEEPEPEIPEGYDPYPDGSDEPQTDEGGYEAGSLEALLAAADLGAAIRVLNDTAPSGEAGRGSNALSAAGFTSTGPGNFPGDSGLTATSVWYSGDNQATALAVAKVLGIPEDRVSEHATSQGVINVILRGALQLP